MSVLPHCNEDTGLAAIQSVLRVHADRELRTRRPLMLKMLSLDERVIRQDRLCYLTERIVMPR